MPVGDVSKLEGIGTEIKATGTEIAKGDMCLRRRTWKARKRKNLGGIRGRRVSFDDQCDISLIADQILKSQKSRLR